MPWYELRPLPSYPHPKKAADLSGHGFYGNMSAMLTLPASAALNRSPDRFLVCEACGIRFVWTGQEQAQGEQPQRCPGCRHLHRLTQRLRGAVKWYDARKGFGFITAADGAEYFVHRSALGQRRVLRRGQVVAFRLGGDEGTGPQAVELEVLPRPPAEPGS